MALITVSELEDLMNTDLVLAQAQAVIDDASALVVDEIVNDDEITASWDETTTPAAVKAIVKQMCQRALENPTGLSGEAIDGYSWQSSTAASIYATRRERRMIRKIVGKLGVGVVVLESDVPVAEPDRTSGVSWLDGAL